MYNNKNPHLHSEDYVLVFKTKDGLSFNKYTL